MFFIYSEQLEFLKTEHVKYGLLQNPAVCDLSTFIYCNCQKVSIIFSAMPKITILELVNA